MKRLLQSFLLTVCLWGTVNLGSRTPPAVHPRPANTPISYLANF